MDRPPSAAATAPGPHSVARSPARGHARDPAPSGTAAAHGGFAPSQNGSEKVEARLAKVLGKLDAKKDERAQAAKQAKLEARLKKAELAKAAKAAKRLAEEQREAEVITTPVKQRKMNATSTRKEPRHEKQGSPPRAEAPN